MQASRHEIVQRYYSRGSGWFYPVYKMFLAGVERPTQQETTPGNLDRTVHRQPGCRLHYDTEGKMTSVSYPNAGPTYTYSFDSIGRPNRAHRSEQLRGRQWG